ncbi:Fcf2-domain-containing protein [Pluteus cervinus]|uniref:Fcf2-domain-containing protein n=1 Tax=Pluteus cervinus TaxID=181527 RepID=A0ACD3B9A8_9AGAR|nr:Fcf2-domain-containing protein [Pluteus cervinus]
MNTPAASISVQEEDKDKNSELEDSSSGSEEESSSSSESESGTDSDTDEEITPEYLQSLINKAIQNARADEASEEPPSGEEELIILEKDKAPLPPHDPGALPQPYINLDAKSNNVRVNLRDPAIESAERVVSSLGIPAPPVPPPELTKFGKPLTKREKNELKKRTAGPDWFDLPAPREAELPRLYREVEAMRLRNQLDPKRFYKKDEGEGKGIKGLPKYFAVGTILPSSNPFGASTSDTLPKAQRKRTIVEELVDDAEAKRYAKRKFDELQTVRGARGKKTLAARKSLRKPKW